MDYFSSRYLNVWLTTTNRFKPESFEECKLIKKIKFAITPSDFYLIRENDIQLTGKNPRIDGYQEHRWPPMTSKMIEESFQDELLCKGDEPSFIPDAIYVISDIDVFTREGFLRKIYWMHGDVYVVKNLDSKTEVD